MSSWIVKYESKGNVSSGSDILELALAQCIADSETDLPSQDAFTGKRLYKGSTCKCLQECTEWELNSSAVWKKQESANSVTLDLSGYYTSAQVDAAITAAVNSALASYTTTADMNTAINTAIMTTQYTNRGTEPADGADILDLPVGRYFKSSNAQTLVNIPSTFSGAACVFEIRNTTTTTGTRMRIDFWSCSPNNEPHYWFAVKASTPAVWKPWIEMTGTVLT